MYPVSSLFGATQCEGHRGGSQEEPPWENKCDPSVATLLRMDSGPKGSQRLAAEGKGQWSCFEEAQKTDPGSTALESVFGNFLPCFVLFCFVLRPLE